VRLVSMVIKFEFPLKADNFSSWPLVSYQEGQCVVELGDVNMLKRI
jgi:hypothetical protein